MTLLFGWCLDGKHGPGKGTRGCPGRLGPLVCPCPCHTRPLTLTDESNHKENT